MSTNDPSQQPPPEAPAPEAAAPEAPGQPRDPSTGQFTGQPEQQSYESPFGTDPNYAVQYMDRLRHPTKWQGEVEGLLRERGVLPEGLDIQTAQNLLSQYAEYAQNPLNGVVPQQPQYDQQAAMQQPGMPQPQYGQGNPWEQIDPMEYAGALEQHFGQRFNPDEIRQQAVQEAMTQIRREQQNAEINGSIERLAEANGLNDAQKGQLLQNVATQILMAEQNGQQINPGQVGQLAQQTYDNLVAFGQQAVQQQAAEAAQQNPQTGVPTGQPAGGQYPKGLEGAAQRQLEAWRAQGGGT